MAKDPQTQLPILGPILEGSSAVFSTLIVNEQDIPIKGLSSLVVSLFDLSTGSTINYRNKQDVLNTNGGVFDSTTGIYTLSLSPLDIVLLNQEKFEEDHIFRCDYSYNSGSIFGHYAALIRVRNLNRYIS